MVGTQERAARPLVLKASRLSLPAIPADAMHIERDTRLPYGLRRIVMKACYALWMGVQLAATNCKLRMKCQRFGRATHAVVSRSSGSAAAPGLV